MAIDINIPSQVKTYANLAAFPATGSLKTIFIAEDTNKTYRWTGSAYVEISAAGASGITIGTTAITSRTVGRVLFEGTGNVVQESANLFWDNTNGRLGVGTSSPTNAVDITQTGGGFLSFNRTAGASASISITNIRTGGGQGLVFDTASFSFRNGSSKNLILDGGRIGVNTNDDALTASFNVKGTGATSATKNILFKNSANTDLFTIWDDGAVGVKTSTNAGFAFDVNGTARVNNALTIGSNQYLRAFRWTQDDVNRALTMESNSPYNFDSVNIISSNNNLLNNTKNILNLGLASTVSTQSSGSTDFFNVLNIPTTYNFTFGTHTVKGIYYNPTLTSMVGTTHYAFHSTSGRHRYENLPTSSAGLASGDLWNDAGTLKIV